MPIDYNFQLFDFNQNKANIPTELLGKLFPKTAGDMFGLGFGQILPAKATYHVLVVDGEGNQKEVVNTPIKLKAQSEEEMYVKIGGLTYAISIGNEYSKDEKGRGCCAFGYIEVTGGLLHNIDIEGRIYEFETEYFRRRLGAVYGKGIIRTISSISYPPEEKKEGGVTYYIHPTRLTGRLVNKYVLYMVDGWGYSIYNIPKSGTIVETILAGRLSGGTSLLLTKYSL